MGAVASRQVVEVGLRCSRVPNIEHKPMFLESNEIWPSPARGSWDIPSSAGTIPTCGKGLVCERAPDEQALLPVARLALIGTRSGSGSIRAIVPMRALLFGRLILLDLLACARLAWFASAVHCSEEALR